MTDRGRVPFALIGVLLLVSSGTLAVTQHAPVVSEPAVDRAMDGLTAETHTALRQAVRTAAGDAARNPVVEPAETPVGDVLAHDRPFEDALRLRIYLEARSHLGRVSAHRRGLDLSASLPPLTDTDDVRDAIDRVRIAPAGPEERKLRVRIDGVRLRALRDGTVVGDARRAPELVVDTPVLAVHDRVETFESRLNRYVGRPGLASRLSAYAYPIAWARGWAQYEGAPIENVVANRHVALLTNGAVLAEQRAAFGVSDPVGRKVYRRMALEVGIEDLVSGTDSKTIERLDRARRTVGSNATAAGGLERLEPPAEAPDPSDTTTVEIGRTADGAYLDAVRSLDETLDATYAPLARVRAAVDRRGRRVTSGHDAGSDWVLLGERTRVSTRVRNRSGTPPASARGWHEIAGYSRTVEVVERTTRRWQQNENETALTSRTVRTTATVDLLVEGRHVVGPAPDGRIATVHERGAGPLAGPNLADTPERIRETVLEGRGGVDKLAARAARGKLNTEPTAVQGARPDALREWAGADLPALRRQVRNVSVEVRRADVATFRRNVPAELAGRLRDRRSELIDAPETYGSVAERARVGVRADYVDRVLAVLDRKATRYENARDGLDDVFPSVSGAAADVLADGFGSDPGSGSEGGDGLHMIVDASPGYLSIQAVDAETVPAIEDGRSEHPLVARNVNGFGLPTADVVEKLFGLLSGPEKTDLASAIEVLRVARDGGLDGVDVGTDSLVREVANAERGTSLALAGALGRRGLGEAAVGRLAAVHAALSRWNGTGARARALVNGSAAVAVHREALQRWPGEFDDRHDRERLAIALDFAVESALDDERFQPRLEAVNDTAEMISDVLETDPTGTGDAVEELGREKAAMLAARLPSGVPVIPGPGTWYATVNAWHVQVRGSYAAFVVRVSRGSPEGLPADLTYVRENRTVRLDVDGDGAAERLGHNERVTFAAETLVGVAVPPGPQGVGDVHERDERSAGWPDPGPIDDESNAE